ncbi:MAG: PspA/IM30 family protein [Halanaerobacter sp.]
MNLFKRMKRIITGKDSDNIDFFMTETIKEMEEEYKDIKERINQSINLKKQLEDKYVKAQEEIDYWKEKAKTSFKENEDEVAKKALEKKHSQDRLANKYERQLEKNEEKIKKYRARIDEIEEELAEAGVKEKVIQEEIN